MGTVWAWQTILASGQCPATVAFASVCSGALPGAGATVPFRHPPIPGKAGSVRDLGSSQLGPLGPRSLVSPFIETQQTHCAPSSPRMAQKVVMVTRPAGGKF